MNEYEERTANDALGILADYCVVPKNTAERTRLFAALDILRRLDDRPAEL
ncbi:hypothetical protein ACIRD0_08060 [Streptomyces microflavus]